MGSKKAASNTILTEAQTIINGARRDSYGGVEESFTNIAGMWSIILGCSVSPQQAAHCMIALKLVRESASHGRDNLVDVCGYAALCGELEGDA